MEQSSFYSMNGNFVRAWGNRFGRAVELLVGSNRGQSVYLADEILLDQVIDEPGVAPKPSMTIAPPAAQQLMDDLWTAGFRPSEGVGSAGSLRAVEKHLADMRAIAFNRLKVDKP